MILQWVYGIKLLLLTWIKNQIKEIVKSQPQLSTSNHQTNTNNIYKYQLNQRSYFVPELPSLILDETQLSFLSNRARPLATKKSSSNFLRNIVYQIEWFTTRRLPQTLVTFTHFWIIKTLRMRRSWKFPRKKLWEEKRFKDLKVV